jgi:hypothetical protein
MSELPRNAVSRWCDDLAARRRDVRDGWHSKCTIESPVNIAFHPAGGRMHTIEARLLVTLRG